MKKRLSILLGSGILAWLLGNVAHAAELSVGSTAPDFSAPADNGSVFRLSEHIGQGPIVLYFYPKDDTPGCTKEACGIRDNYAAFRDLNAQVYGVSYDDVDAHQKFITKYKLPFVLLSDKDRTIAKMYGANGLLGAKRQTFIIDRKGKIAWIQRNVTAATHASELKKVLSQL